MMEINEIIQNCIKRELSDDVKESKVSMFESGINSIELIQIIVEIEKIWSISLDEFLDRIDILTIDMIRQVIIQGKE